MDTFLVVEDELAIRAFLEINLQREGFNVDFALCGEDALAMAKEKRYDGILLDVMLPGMDGYTTCLKLREQGFMGIVIMVTARGQDADKIMGLELGADDYLVKPFNPQELITRYRALKRRTQSYAQMGRPAPESSGDALAFETFTIDLKARQVLQNGVPVTMAPKEFELLIFLAQTPNVAHHRDAILDAVWGSDFYGDFKTVDVHVRRLREKIEQTPGAPSYIQTVWGHGYRWAKEAKL